MGSATIAAAPIRLGSLDLGATRFADIDAVVAELAMFEALDFSGRPLLILGAPVMEACEILSHRPARAAVRDLDTSWGSTGDRASAHADCQSD